MADNLIAPMSDTQLIRWLRDNLEWDGHGYWLHELCVRENPDGDKQCEKPTLDEFRAILGARANQHRSTK